MIKSIGQMGNAPVDLAKLREGGKSKAADKIGQGSAVAAAASGNATPIARMAAQGAPVDMDRVAAIKEAIASGNDALYEAFGDLRRALDTRDASEIHNATKKVKAASDTVRTQGAWKMDAELRGKLESLKPLIESARVRVNIASDDVRQRIALLGGNAGNSASANTYSR